MKKTIFFLLTSLLLSLPLSAQEDKEEWEPIAVWPFMYKDFSNAVITTVTKVVVKSKANIHVGNHYLWYINSAQQKVIAKEGTIAEVRFSNGDSYLPIGNKLCRVIRTDTINGKVCHVLRSDEVDKERFNELTNINRMTMMSFGSGNATLENMYTGVAEHEGAKDIDKQPLPMNTYFYMQYNGDTFQVTESNVLKHLDKIERAAYRAYTRRAEILYANESSILNIWDTFFKK